MFLEFGIYFGEWVHVQQVPAGKTQLVCPYCKGLLVAKKGKIKIPHFAHLGETCREVVNRSDNQLNLPLYEKFDLNINGKTLSLLEGFYKDLGLTFLQLEILEKEGLIYSVPTKFGSKMVLTKIAKIFFGEASLYSFSEIQEKKISEKHEEIESCLDLNNPLLDSLLTDLRIYRNQIRRVLSSDLYFIEIKTKSENTFYKIGVTTRNIDDRLSEIRTDLKKHFQIQSISVLRLLKHRGSIETYFKHRYRKHLNKDLKTVGGFTEYFNFDKNERKRVLSDLTRLGDKTLNSFEEDILDNKKTAIERNITKRKNIKAAMRKTAEKGRNIGRPKGAVESRDKILAKYPLVVEAINKELSLRKTAEFANVSINTVRLVKKILETN